MEEVAQKAAGTAANSFLDRGILGVVALGGVLIACFFYREMRRAEQRERDTRDKCEQRIEGLVEKWNTFAQSMRLTIESMTKRFG